MSLIIFVCEHCWANCRALKTWGVYVSGGRSSVWRKFTYGFCVCVWTMMMILDDERGALGELAKLYASA